MQVKDLGNTNIDAIIACFLEAFEGYFVEMPTDYPYYKQRWEVAKVDFDLSYGMFENDKLVGFIINAVDKRDGENIAYNTGTGVIPKYRGQKIIKTIYAFAIPNLIKNGITKCTLEVITENVRAINSYKSIGFSINKTYKCFSGTIQTKNKIGFNLKEVVFENYFSEAIPNQDFYSWDFHKNCIENGNYSYFQVLKNELVESCFAINLETGYVAQCDVFIENDLSWNTLFEAIKSVSETVKIINVDDRLTNKLNAIESVKLTKTVNQYEMIFNLPKNR